MGVCVCVGVGHLIRRHTVRFLLCAVFLQSATPVERPWTEVRSSHFRIVTDSGEDAAQALAVHAERVREFFATAFPHWRTDPHGEVVILTVDENADLWRARLGEQAGHVRLGNGLYQGGEYRHYIGVRQRLGHSGAEILGHEYFHLIAAINFRSVPLWLNEGLAAFFAVAEPVGSGWQSIPPAYAELLKRSEWIPLPELFSADKHSRHYVDAASAPLFYAQSWAVTHYLLTGDGGRHAPTVWRLLRRLDEGVPYAIALPEEVGDVSALESSVKKHLAAAVAFSNPAQHRGGVLASSPYPTRHLTAGEAAAIRGDFLLHAGNLASAENALRDSLQGDPNLAAAAESMGLLSMKRKEPAEAAKWFARAAGQPSAGPLAHYYHAEFIAADAKDSAALQEAEAQLLATLKQDGNFARAHAALAGIFLLRGDFDRALEFAERAVELEPRDLAYQLDLARIMARRGDMQSATRTAELALHNSRTASERGRAENLLQYFDQSQQAQIDVQRFDRELAEHKARRSQPASDPSGPARSPQDESGAPRAQAYAWGTIKSVTCATAKGLQLTLDSQEGPLHLRARNYTVVPYYDARAATTKGFDPCRSLTGTFAGIMLRPTPGAAHQGEILSIEIHAKP